MHLSGLSTRGPLRPTSRPAAAAWRLLVVAVLVLGLVSVGSPTPARAGSDAYVATDALNLRDEPGTWGGIIAEMWRGDYVYVIDGPTEDGWYWVDHQGRNGWAYGAYLSIDGQAGWGAAAEAQVGGGGGSAWVGSEALNVRSRASRNSGVLDTLPYGAELAIAGDAEAGFYPILYGGGIGWVWADLVTWEQPSGGRQESRAGPERWLDVDRSSSTVRMMVGDEPIATYAASLGWDDSASGFYATAIGSYRVYDMHAPLSWTPWAQAYIKYWIGFDASRVNGFHSHTMNENGRTIEGGDGPTGGCVATDVQSAKEIYNFASVGMRVEVHW